MLDLRVGEVVTLLGAVYAVVDIRGDRVVLRSGDGLVRIARIAHVKRVVRPGSIMGPAA